MLVAPAPLTDPRIDYPDNVTTRSTGVVAVRFTVLASGNVTNVTVLQASADPFTRPVIDALLRTPFAPATRDGVPFDADVEVEIEVPPPYRAPPIVTGFLTGTVYEQGSRRLLPGVQVTLPSSGAVTSTNASGVFRLRTSPGAITVVVSAPGYRIAQFAESVSAAERLEVVYRLVPEGLSPLELVVEAERERAEVSRVRLDTRELRSVPGTFDDAIRVVQKLPSVSQTNEFSGELIVRGSDSRDTKIFLDGIEVPFVFHFGSIKSIVATELIQEVVLYPSNFSVRYGDAIGGVLDVRIRDPKTDRWQGRALVSSLLSEAYAEGPLGDKAGMQIGARSSYAHLFIDKVIPDRAGVNFSTLPKFRDYQSRLVGRKGKWTLRGFVFGAQDELALIGEENRQLDPDSPFNAFSQTINQHSQTLNASYAGQALTGTTLAGFTRTAFELNLANSERFRISQDTLTVRTDWETRLHRLLLVAAGMDWLYTRQEINIFFPRPPRPGEFDYDFFTVERLLFDATDKFYSGGAYTEFRVGPQGGPQAAVGGRLNFYSDNVETADPRALFLYPTDEYGTFKTGYGIYHQSPKGIETAPDPVGNPDAGPNRAHHTMVGWQETIVWNLDTQVELFYKWIDHLITENPEPLGEPRYQNWGKGRAYGFEFSLRKPLTEKVSGWVNYSFTRSFRRVQPGFPEEPFAFDQPHVFNLVASWVPSAKWEVGGAFRVASGNPQEELLQTLYFGDRASYIPIFGELNERQRPYLRLDTRVKRTWLFDTWNLAWLFEIINTTNYKNIVFTEFNDKTRERETANGFPFFPYIGLEAEF